MKEICVTADCSNLDTVATFVEGELEHCACDERAKLQILVTVEEIFVNIANYAYRPEMGEAWVSCVVEEEPLQVIIQFLDGGKPFNPLEKDSPDTTLSAEEREVGGLGIFLVKEHMDFVDYEYKEGKNILTVKKLL